MKKRGKPRLIFIVVGARPNFMKAAPLIRELKKEPGFLPLLIHTGQHYDRMMSDSFFKELRLPRAWLDLGVGSGTHAVQTGRIMIEFEKACLARRPDLVVVVGDVNSTIACALAAVKLNIPVAHVEAGLRSRDWSMPEEINRLLTDQISSYLFTTCEDANRNLSREGIPKKRIFFVGNVMIDSLRIHLGKASNSNILGRLGFVDRQGARKFALLTLHRPSNVDDPAVLRRVLGAIAALSQKIAVVFPAHPRTIKQIRSLDFQKGMSFRKSLPAKSPVGPHQNFIILPALGYHDFLHLMSRASLVLTDSGGIQEETTILGIPCLTLRDNTERPVTIEEGTNLLVGNDPDRILRAASRILESQFFRPKKPRYWDGRAASRIAKILKANLIGS
jgi:UDP-N-acetylglucosamine 2-epimerase (non-hydrolysing)